MAQPNKTGLSFYRSNTNRYQDPKIRRLLKKYKADGITVWDYIINEIYRLEGCFIIHDDNLIFNASDILNVEEETVKEIIKYCVEIELFSAEIFAKHQILTSIAIQKFYSEAARVMKRKFLNIPEFIKLIQEVTTQQSEVITELTEVTTQHNLTEPNLTKQSLIYLENPKENGLKKGDLFFHIDGTLFKESVAVYFEKNYQLAMEGELIKRGMAYKKDEVLKKFEEKYGFTNFQNSRHLYSSFKICIDIIKKGDVIPSSVNTRKKTIKKNELTNWNGSN